MEGKHALNVLADLGFADDEAELMDSLQDVHDNLDLTTWERGFQNVAEDYQLVYAPKKRGS